MATNVKKSASAKSSEKTTVEQNPTSNVTHLRLLAADEKAPRSMDYLGDGKLRVVGTVRFNEKSDKRYIINSVYDFSKCNEAEILEMAASSVRITMQGRIRAMGESVLTTKPFANVDVKAEVVDVQKTTVDDMTRAVRSYARALGVSEDDARKILEAGAAKQAVKSK